MDSAAPATNRNSVDSNWDEVGDEQNMATMTTGDSAGLANARSRAATGIIALLLLSLLSFSIRSNILRTFRRNIF